MIFEEAPTWRARQIPERVAPRLYEDEVEKVSEQCAQHHKQYIEEHDDVSLSCRFVEDVVNGRHA